MPNAARRTGTLDLKPAGTLVYRVYGWSDELLYIGITDDICRRFAQHRFESLWWHRSSRVEWEEWPSRFEAESEEGRLIKRHQPIFNVAKNRPAFHVILDAVDTHEPGCTVGAIAAHRALALGDRF